MKAILKQCSYMLLLMLFVFLFLFFTRGKAKAEAITGDNPAHGYFWYECSDGFEKNDRGGCSPIPKVEEAAKQGPTPQPALEPAPTPPPKTVEKTPEPEPPVIANTGPNTFSFPITEEAKRVPALKEFLLHPTEENATNYLAWQYKYMEHLNKIGYSLRSAFVRFGSEVYPIQGYPESPQASVQYASLKEGLFKAAINSMHDKLGLVYVYSLNCEVCRMQKDTIIGFVRKYNLSARGLVEAEANIDPDLPFPSTVNKQRIHELGVTQTPTLLAVVDDNGTPKIGGISVGYMPMDQMENQIIRFLIEGGFIKEKDLNPLFVQDDGVVGGQ